MPLETSSALRLTILLRVSPSIVLFDSVKSLDPSPVEPGQAFNLKENLSSLITFFHQFSREMTGGTVECVTFDPIDTSTQTVQTTASLRRKQKSLSNTAAGLNMYTTQNEKIIIAFIMHRTFIVNNKISKSKIQQEMNNCLNEFMKRYGDDLMKNHDEFVRLHKESLNDTQQKSNTEAIATITKIFKGFHDYADKFQFTQNG